LQPGADQFQPSFASSLRSDLSVLRRHGLRPILILQAPNGPPRTPTTLRLVEGAPAGARSLLVDGRSEPIQPGRTAFRVGGQTIFVTALDGARLALSRGLPAALPAGELAAFTYTIAPFRRPTRADGTPDRQLEEGLAGWSRYVSATIALVREVMGPAGFDLQLWNMNRHVDDLWDVERFHDPLPEDLGPGGPNAGIAAVIATTQRTVRAATAGLDVKLVNGFLHQRWGDIPAEHAQGFDAVGRHLYMIPLSFPPPPAPRRFLDAAGRPDGVRAENGLWEGARHPIYVAHVPERALSALGPSSFYRDVAPFPQRADRPAMWIDALTFMVPARPAGLVLTPAERARTKAKAAMRALAAYVHKGASRIWLQNHMARADWLIDPASPELTIVPESLARFMKPFQAPPDPSPGPPVTLEAIAACPSRFEVPGQNDDAHPGLRSSDLLAFFPFRVSSRRVVVVIYVMTRNLTIARGGAMRLDLPPERFTLRIDAGGLEPQAMIDPLSAAPLSGDELRLVARDADSVTVDVALTDSPRLLVLER
jgi:hypothetical protein